MELSRKPKCEKFPSRSQFRRKQNIQLDILDSQVYAKWMKNLNLISHAM